jgi:hypothetical protein
MARSMIKIRRDFEFAPGGEAPRYSSLEFLVAPGGEEIYLVDRDENGDERTIEGLDAEMILAVAAIINTPKQGQRE